MEDEEKMVKAEGLEDAILGTGGRINMDEVSYIVTTNVYRSSWIEIK